MEWIAETHIQVGDTDDPPWRHLDAFLRAFVEGLDAAGAGQPTLLDITADDEMYANPTRHVCFRLLAPHATEAERLAQGQFFRAGLDRGVAAVPPDAREFGWFVSWDVRPA